MINIKTKDQQNISHLMVPVISVGIILGCFYLFNNNLIGNPLNIFSCYFLCYLAGWLASLT